MNFSFHTLLGTNDFMDFSQFTQPVIAMLNKMNVPARLEGRNDLLVDGKKFSGNAKLAKNGKMIQHGTILLNSQMNVLVEAIKVNPLKFVDKAVKSNRARVTNLIDYLPENTTTEILKHLLIGEMLQNNTGASIYQFTQEDIEGIEKLVAEKYSTWDWNYGSSPNYNFKKAVKIPAGFIELHLDVDKGVIEKVKIFGDFFASRPIEELEKALTGQRHDVDQIEQLLSSTDLTAYFGKVSVAEILELFK
nr:lipoate--protein ligase [Sphingobacterium spiritivorum]